MQMTKAKAKKIIDHLYTKSDYRMYDILRAIAIIHPKRIRHIVKDHKIKVV
ncbi:hypothetical protein LCGC14_0948520 [marine sediment metagenome]|uniref:Uncharacterized protein n=1 Tax=marine sediment metagenome TaxID=412755 RepID=A0A0F9R1H9_9ZZZZ